MCPTTSDVPDPYGNQVSTRCEPFLLRNSYPLPVSVLVTIDSKEYLLNTLDEVRRYFSFRLLDNPVEQVVGVWCRRRNE